MPFSQGNAALQVKFADVESSSPDPKLFVGNLAPETMESELVSAFSPCGPISEVVILRSGDGSARGAGFVRFRTLEAAQSAIETMNGRFELHGRLLTVSMAETSRDKQQRKKGVAPLMASRSSAANAMSPYDRSPYAGSSYAAYPPPPPASAAGYYSGVPMLSVPYPATNLESVIQGIESRLAYIGQQRGPELFAPPAHAVPVTMSPLPPMHSPAPVMSAIPLSTGGYTQGQQQQWAPSADSLLSMMMPRPSSDMNAKVALGSKQEGPKDSNLFIVHFPKEWRNEDLYSAFAPYGRIVSANIFLDKETRESRCFGFVSYDNPHSAMAAVAAMNGQQIGSKRIKVELKRQ